MHIFLLAVLIEAASCDSHARTNQLPHRSTIVHLFEWKWKDIADECETFLGPKGFGAVQISPPSENLIMHLKHLKNARPWYERYRPMSYKINTRSGSQEEFFDMTTRCNKAGVRSQNMCLNLKQHTIYADVVLNHMAGDYDTNIGTAGSTADFEKYHYPAVPYEREHFHEPCTINFNIAKQVRECQLDGTNDLNHKNKHVREQIVDYLKNLLDLGVAGFRIDAAKHMWPEDLRDIYSQLGYFKHGHLSRSKPYIYHEVTHNATGEAVKPFEYTQFGDVTDYRVGEELKNLFRGYYSLKLLRNWGPDWGLLPSENAVISIDNHETQREDDVLNYKEAKAYKAAIAFILAHPYGKPRVMSSYYFDKWEQGPPSDTDGNILSPGSTIYSRLPKNESCGHGWVCEHRWRQIYQMVAFRNAVRGTEVIHWWDNGNNLIAFSRGDKGFVAFNLEDGRDMKATIRTALPPGEYCDVISGERDNNQCTGRKVIVTEHGSRRVIDIIIPAHDEDTHIAIHVGPESLLQTSMQPQDTSARLPMVDDDGLSWQTTQRWHQERDPLPPLTSELPRTETSKEEDTNSQSSHSCHREHDPLPQLTSPQPRIVENDEINTSQTGQQERWHREASSSTPEPATTTGLEEQDNKIGHSIHHWRLERDPLPPLTSQQPRILTWENKKNVKRQISHHWRLERYSLPPVTSQQPRILTWENEENMGRKTSHHRRLKLERDPLSPLTSQKPRLLSWESENMGRQTNRRREYNPPTPLTSELPRILVLEKHEKTDRPTSHQQRWHREHDPPLPLTSEVPIISILEEKQEEEDRHISQQQSSHREYDPLPPLKSILPKSVVLKIQKKNSRKTIHQQYQHRHRKRNPFPRLTSESAIVSPSKKHDKKGRKTIHQQYQHRHRKRNPFPRLTSESAIVSPSKKHDKKGRQTSHQNLHRNRDPLSPLTSEPASVVSAEIHDTEGRQTSHQNLHRNRDPLSPLTSEPASVLSAEIHDTEGRQTSHQNLHRNRDPLSPLTSEPASVLSAEIHDTEGRQTSHQNLHRNRDPLPPLTSKPASVVSAEIHDTEGRKSCRRLYKDHNSTLPLSELLRIATLEKQQTKSQLTSQHRRYDRDPLQPLTLEPDKIVAWKKKRRKCKPKLAINKRPNHYVL